MKIKNAQSGWMLVKECKPFADCVVLVLCLAGDIKGGSGYSVYTAYVTPDGDWINDDTKELIHNPVAWTPFPKIKRQLKDLR